MFHGALYEQFPFITIWCLLPSGSFSGLGNIAVAALCVAKSI